MKKNLVVLLLLVVPFSLSVPISASPQGDILLQLRFYEGVRGPGPAEAKVVTAYTLRPLFVGNFITEKGLQEEESELKRVFNLKDLDVLVQTQWAWEQGRADKRFQMVVLNGHEFLLQVVKLKNADAFQIQVFDQAKKQKTALLDNEVLLPAGKVAVFGFEDTLAQPYFLALQRQADAEVIQVDALQPVAAPEALSVPRILKKVDPVYPAKMFAAGIPGSATIQVEVDERGRVWSAKPFRSQEDEFVKAAVDAVKQWQVEPLVIDGEVRPQSFTCTFSFHRGGGVALDFSGPFPLNSREEALAERIRSLCQPRLGKDFKAEKVTLRMQDEPAAIAAKILAMAGGIPVRAAAGLAVKLNGDVRDLPWDQAMARLLEGNGLDVTTDGGEGLLIVLPFQAIWPTSGYVWERGEKRPDGTIASLVKKTGKMYYMSSGFGKRLNPRTKKEEFHSGIDILAKLCAPVLSVAEGTVVASDFDDQRGHRIVIDHGNGYSSAYYHLTAREVEAGQRVKQGQRIGSVGSSGVSSGPHLHFEIRVDGEPRNPFDFIGN